MKTKLVIKLILVFSFFLGFTLQIPNVQATQYIKPQEFKITGPTRVVAGKYFTINLSSDTKISATCHSGDYSKGFAVLNRFKFNGYKLKIKMLPISPGAGKIHITCTGKTFSPSGYLELYIAPK
jgi:hypothetical protein